MLPRVLIVDDHPGYRSLARELLKSEGIEVVGEAADGDGALREARDLQPGLVLVDVYLRETDGFEVARRLADLPTPPAVVLMSSRDVHDLGRRMAGVPAVGFIAKDKLSAAALVALVG